ncbi:MAG: ABC transporter permease subunit [Acidobacteria bacterium]|nr:ABC transporter permease subunit [Acidobacteriota bacterium]
MNNVWAIATKELRSYFLSPIAYVVLSGFLLIMGFMFWNMLAQFSRFVAIYSSMQQPGMLEQLSLNDMVVMPLLGNMTVVFILMMPLLTMRLFAEERASGTDELLLTSPISTLEIAFGKFFGATLFLCVLLGLAFAYPAILMYFGNPEIAPILTGYLALLLLGMSAIALGLFASTVTDSQIVAGVLAGGMLLMLLLINWPADAVGESMGAVLRYLSITEHSTDMMRGLIKVEDVVYYLSLISVGIFLSQRSLESLRWR